MSFLKKKSYGQHFLHEQGVIEKIAGLVRPAATTVEIGPGQGALTRMLNASVRGDLILVEADPELFEHLELEFRQARLLRGDAARVELSGWVHEDWVCVGNLPYNAAAAIMTHVLRQHPRPKQCVFMIQREQADRVCAAPGDMSMLSLAVQLYATATKQFNVAPGAFSPPPKVESTVIELIPKPEVNETYNEAVLAFAQHGFVHRRKQLLRSLTHAGYTKNDLETAFTTLGIRTDIRPQELSVEAWTKLFDLMHKRPRE